MKKSKFKIETLVFSLVFATNLIVPVAMNGQGSRADGFFTTSSNDYGDRAVEGEVLQIIPSMHLSAVAC